MAHDDRTFHKILISHFVTKNDFTFDKKNILSKMLGVSPALTKKMFLLVP